MTERTLVFLPGFMAGAKAYDALLAPVIGAGWQVVVPQLYPRGVGALMGHHPVRKEAAAATALVRGRCVIGGHSRGGQAAWLAAGRTDVAGVILIDPVDGEGRGSDAPTSTAGTAGFTCPCLIIGAERAGRCAPRALNYERFTAMTPTAEQVVVADLGHADVLSGRARTVGRRLCGGGADPDASRTEVSHLMVRFLAALG